MPSPSPRALILSLLLLAALSSGCKSRVEPSAGADAEAPKAKQRLVVYSGRAEALVGPLFQRFQQETGIELQLRYADSAQLAATILEEGKNSPADVFFSQDVSTLGVLSERGSLAPLNQALLAKVDATARSPDAKWVGTSGRARVLVYNTDRVKPDALPSLDDLTDPKWKGRVAWAPENASFQSFLVAMVETEGLEATRSWLEAMKKNDPRAFPSNTPLVAAVAAGDVDVGLANHYYLFRMRDELGAVKAENHYFRNGKAESFVSLSGAGVVTSSQQPALAAQLIDYLLSADAQGYLAKENHEFPTVAGVPTSDALPSVESLRSPAVPKAGLANLEQAVKLLRETGILL